MLIDLTVQNAFNFKKINKDLPTAEKCTSIFWYKVRKIHLDLTMQQLTAFFNRGLQEDRTKKVIEEIKKLEYELESKMKTVSERKH